MRATSSLAYLERYAADRPDISGAAVVLEVEENLGRDEAGRSDELGEEPALLPTLLRFDAAAAVVVVVVVLGRRRRLKGRGRRRAHRIAAARHARRHGGPRRRGAGSRVLEPIDVRNRMLSFTPRTPTKVVLVARDRAQPEIAEPHVVHRVRATTAAGAQQQVLALDVSVHDALAVAVSDRVRERVKDLARRARGHAAADVLGSLVALGRGRVVTVVLALLSGAARTDVVEEVSASALCEQVTNTAGHV